MQYGVEDVIYTTRGNNLYVAFLGKPEGLHLLFWEQLFPSRSTHPW